MSFVKTVEKLAKNHTVLFTIVAAVALVYVMKNYSQGKGFGGIAGMANPSASAPLQGAFSDAGDVNYKLNPMNPPQPAGAGGAPSGNCGQGSNYKPSNGLGRNENSAPVSGVTTNTFGMPPSCAKQAVVDPKQ